MNESGDKNINKGKGFIIIGLMLGLILGVLVSAIAINFMDIYFKREGIVIEMIKVLIVFILVFISFYIQIIIHESGHLVFGLLSGYTFVSFRIGSATLIRNEGKWEMKKFNIPGTGGQCLLMPPEADMENVPFVLYNLGGVIFNLIFGVIPVLIVILIETTAPWLKGFLLVLGFVGIISVLLNGIPLKATGVANDGSNIISMVKDKDARRAFYSQLRFNGLLSQGIRPREMNINDFKFQSGDVSSPLNTALILMEYNYYLDKMEFEKGRELLRSLNPHLNNILGIYRFEINCEKVFLELVLNGDRDLVERLYDKELLKYMKACKGMISKTRVKMSYELLFKKDVKMAEELHEEGKALEKTYPIKGEIKMELMLMDYLNNITVY
ncbi:MAG: hypothetical protein RR844_00730 [Clostridium sp.]